MQREKPQTEGVEAGPEPLDQAANDAAVASLTEKRRRTRVPQILPKPLETSVAPWGKGRPELHGYTAAHAAADLFNSEVWETAIAPVIREAAALDARRNPQGPNKTYSAELLELIMFWQRASGCLTMKEALFTLEGPRAAEARMLLGIADHCHPEHILRRLKGLDGVPSQATMSRHNALLSEEVRAGIWEDAARRLRDIELSLIPDDSDEWLIFFQDATNIDVPYTCPQFEKDGDGVPTGVVLNEKRVTCWDGGILPKDSHGHGAHGYALMLITNGRAVPIVYDIARNSDTHGKIGTKLIQEKFEPLLGNRLRQLDKIPVLSADSAFASEPFRRAVREAGMIENAHKSSHANRRDRKSDEASSAEKESAKFEPLEGLKYRGWGLNGHRELRCACGRQNVSKVMSRLKDGRVTARIEGKCDNSACEAFIERENKNRPYAFVSIASGQWERNDQTKTWRRADPLNPRSDPRLDVGNGLTFNDPLAGLYGTSRWAYNEGFHGVLATQYKLISGKRYLKPMAQARIDCAVIMACIHLRGIQYRLAQARALSAAA